ncbi:MAG: CPBP family intramembrane glutamic endopeptidase [Candidatus Omnitrophota bacterium]
MKMTARKWLFFILAAVFCFCLWYKFGYPRFISVDLSVDRKSALAKATDYLASFGVNAKDYKVAVIFDQDAWADRYLQKTIGFKKEEEFLGKEQYEIFYWYIRFFKEFEKEEYIFKVGSKTAKILNFTHLIEDIEPREEASKEAARNKAREFLKEYYGLTLDNYDFHREEARKLDQRTDYSFFWEKRGVYIPWEEDKGGAKLLMGATVSGNEVREFFINKLDIPEKFQRYIENQLLFGEYLSSFSFIIFIFFILISIVIVIRNKHTLAIKISKSPYIYIGVFLAAANLVYVLNNIQNLLINYPTSSSLASYIWLYISRLLPNVIVFGVSVIFPGLAGEFLRNERMPELKESSLLHYIKSSFFCRSATAGLILGYLLFFILLGFQAAIFDFGQRYLGVWEEWQSLVQFSSAYFPFLTALILALNAAFNEEIIFRLFGINWANKYFKSLLLGIIFSALVWGFGHTIYAIFPVWFRGLEVTLLGLLFGYIFIRFGLLPVLTAHYLFDAFWGVAAYFLGKSSLYLFSSAVFIMLIPFILALVSFFLNRSSEEKPVTQLFDAHQKYNLSILDGFIRQKKSEGFSSERIREELISHLWDIDVVEQALEDAFGKPQA